MVFAGPGPVNNLKLLVLGDKYKEIIAMSSNPNDLSAETLNSFDNWDAMTLKDCLSYKKDFVVVSGSVWRAIKHSFGGGPEILLFT